MTTFKSSYTTSNIKVIHLYGVVSIVLGAIGFLALAAIKLYDVGAVFFPLGVLISLRSKRTGSKYGLVGFIMNLIGTFIIYGGIFIF